MKRICVLFVLAVLTLTPGKAGPMDGVQVSASSGFVIPSSPMSFADYWKMQYGGGIGAGIPLSESITLVGSFEYYRFKLSEAGISRAFDTEYMRNIWIFKDVSLKASADPSSVATVSANVRFAPSGGSGVLSPYFVAGVGVMRFSLSEIRLPMTSVLSVNGSDILMTAQQTVTGGVETSALFQFGVGFDVRTSESFDMFVEARYTSGMSKGLGTSYVPITGGIRLRL